MIKVKIILKKMFDIFFSYADPEYQRKSLLRLRATPKALHLQLPFPFSFSSSRQ